MRLRICKLQDSKPGDSLLECEDFAFWSGAAGDTETIELSPAAAPYHIALSDGASTSTWAGPWAFYLTTAVVEGRLNLHGTEYASQADALGAAWRHWAEARTRNLSTTDQFFFKDKLAVGAAATLAAVTLTADSADGCIFNAATIGDTCVVLHRHSPSQSLCDLLVPCCSAEMNERPRLIYTSKRVPPASVFTASAPFLPGDVLILATDALAHWYLGENLDLADARSSRLRILRDLICGPRGTRERRFRAWVSRLRRNGDIKPDDVSLVWAEHLGSS